MVAAESLRGDLADAGAVFIDIIDFGDGAGLVVAKYPNEAAMEAAGAIAQAAFGKMVQAGVIDPASIKPKTGAVAISYVQDRRSNRTSRIGLLAMTSIRFAADAKRHRRDSQSVHHQHKSFRN